MSSTALRAAMRDPSVHYRTLRQMVIDYYGPGVEQNIGAWSRYFLIPDMGGVLGKINSRENRGWDYWTVRAVDGLFQDEDATYNRDMVFEAMGLDQHKGGEFETWKQEVHVATLVADYVQSNPELHDYLKRWEKADTEARRAEQRAETIGRILTAVGVVGTVFGLAGALRAGEDVDIPAALNETQQRLNTAGGMIDGQEGQRDEQAREDAGKMAKIAAVIIGVVGIGAFYVLAR